MGVKPLLILLFALCTGCCAAEPNFLDLLLLEAEENYREGERATTAMDREQAFNRALQNYLQVAEGADCAALRYNIGNCYAQLGQYGWALYSYAEAIAQMPRDNPAIYNGQLLRSYLGLPTTVPSPWIERLFFWHLQLSEREKIEWAIYLCSLSALACSIWIWSRLYLMKALTITSTLALSLLLGSLVVQNYLQRGRAILIEPTLLYHAASERSAPLDENALPAGSEVALIDLFGEGKWLKVVRGNGVEGYLPATSVRIVGVDR